MDDTRYKENVVMLDTGWTLHSDGVMRENSTTGFGTVIKPANEFERAKLIVQFWTMKCELAVQEFDEKKQNLLLDVHQRQKAIGNCGGPPCPTEEAVAVLTTLKAKVTRCQEQLQDAEAALELSTPSNVVKRSDISEQNRIRLGEFAQAVKHIEI